MCQYLLADDELALPRIIDIPSCHSFDYTDLYLGGVRVYTRPTTSQPRPTLLNTASAPAPVFQSFLLGAGHPTTVDRC